MKMGLPPGPRYRDLKNGNSIELSDGTFIKPEDVMGPSRPGRTVVVLGDTCNPRNVLPLLDGRRADLLVHESTFSDDDYLLAYKSGHSTSSMAGEFARLCRAKFLALTHFSARYTKGNHHVSAQEAMNSLIASAEREIASKGSHVDCKVITAKDFLRISLPKVL